MIVVVGAGIGGLALGYALASDGVDVLVLEREPRPGGVIRSIEVAERVLDLGPQRARLTGEVARLVDELALTERLVVAKDLPLQIFADGALHPAPLDLRTALTTGLIGWRDRLRALAEPLTDGPRPDESAGDFFTRKFGPRPYERVLGPLFGGLYATDPHEMHARHALATMLAALRIDGSLLRALIRGYRARVTSPAVSFRGGLQTLTDALAAALGPRLRLGAGVAEVRKERRGFRVVSEQGDVLASRVVLTTPPGPAAACLRRLDPDAARRIDRLRMNPIAVVHLESAANLQVQGYQVALGTPHLTHGVTAQHALFGRECLYTAFLGGGKSPGLSGWTDRQIECVAVREFREMTGHDAGALHVHRTAMPAWDTSWSALDGLVLPPGISLCGNWNGRSGLAGRLLAARRTAAALSPGDRATRRGVRRSDARVRA